MSLEFKLPVIKSERVSGIEEPLRDPFLDLPKELIMVSLLNLDPESLLNACSTSKTVRRACESEYFWKSKVLQDFNLSENFELSSEETWKDYYLNRVFPERVFKQLVIEGKADTALGFFISQESNLDFDHSKALLFVLERSDPLFNDLIEHAVYWAIQWPERMERELGLGILCFLAKTSNYTAFDAVRNVFSNYVGSKEEDMDDVLKCAISGGNTFLISQAYAYYLNLNGITESENLNPRARPERFIEYARSIDKTPREIENIVQVLKKQYNAYEAFFKTIMLRKYYVS